MPDVHRRGVIDRGRAGRGVRDRGRLDRRRPARAAAPRPGGLLACPSRGVPVLVTGADGFIGSHLVERLVAEGADVRAFCLYNSRGSAGWLDEAPPDVATRRSTSGSATSATPRFVERGDRGHRGRVPPRRADRDPVLVRRAGVVRRHQRQRHAQRPRGGRPGRRPTRHPDVDERGLRHARDPADPRDAPAPRPVAVRGDEGRRGPARRSRSTAATACRSWSCARSTRTGRASPSARSLPTMLRQLLAGQREIRLGRLDTRRDLTFVADTVDGFVRAADGRRDRRADDPARHRADREHRRAVRARAAPHRQRRDGGRRRPARLRPDASEVLVAPVRPVARPRAARLGGADDASRTASRRRSTGCAASPTPVTDATRVQL